MKENISQLLPDQQISRRNFLKLSGAAAVVSLAAAVGFSPETASAQGGPTGVINLTSSSPETDTGPGTGWASSISIVEGEPPVNGESIIGEPLSSVLDMVRRVEANPILNIRDENGTDTGDLKQNSLVRVLENVEDTDNNDRARITTLKATSDPRTGDLALEQDQEGYIALNYTEPVTVDASGNISFVNESGETVVLPVSANIIHTEQRTAAMPEISSQLASSALPTFFEGVGGGPLETELDADFSKAWASSNEDMPELQSWKRTVFTTAINVLSGRQDNPSTSFDLGKTFGKESFSMFAHATENTVDVVSAKRNPSASANQTIFTISRGTYQDSSQTEGLNVVFKDVGFVTWEGLVTMYGVDKASEMASSITALEADGTVELAEAISTQLPESKVILPGMQGENQFAPKLENVNKKESEEWKYQRINNSYQAKQEFVKNGATQTQELLFFPNSQNGESGDWIQSPEKPTRTLVDLYANIMHLNTQEIKDQMTFETTSDPDGNYYMIGLHDSNPLILYDAQKEAWSEAERSILGKIKGAVISTDVEGWRARNSAIYKSDVLSDANEFDIGTLTVWPGLEPTEGAINTVEWNKMVEGITLGQKNNKKISAGCVSWGHPDFIPQYIKDKVASSSQQEMLQVLHDHRVDFLGQLKDNFSVVTAANETMPHLLPDTPNFWINTVGIPQEEFIKWNCRDSREVVPNAKVAIRDFSIEFAGSPRSDEFFNMISRLNDEEQTATGKNLVDVVEMQLPLMLEPLIGKDPNMNPDNFINPNNRAGMIERFRANIKRFKEKGLDVYVREFFVPIDHLPGTEDEKLKLQAEIYHDFYKAGIEEGAGMAVYRVFSGKDEQMYPPVATHTSPYPRDENFQPTPAYYAINKAIYSAKSPVAKAA